MSKLSKAPLVEVVIEFRWRVEDTKDLASIQYLYGDLYNELKDKYPYRESILPVEIPIEMTLNQPVHRYRLEKGGFPLLQVGPGIITLNTIDEKYFWESLYKDANELIQKFLNIYPQIKLITPALLYIDFFKFSFNESNVLEFMNKNFKVRFDQSFYQSKSFPIGLSMGFSYDSELGELHVNFQKGINSNEEGIIMQTRINGKGIEPTCDNITQWLIDAQELSSGIFKTLTEGELYESFK